MSRGLRAFRAVALHAFKEGIRERTLYNLFFVTVLLLGVGYMAALLVYGHQERVLLHIGWMVNSISIYGVAAGAGARTLRNELEQRTAYLPLVRPVTRGLFFFGKWTGIFAFLTLNFVLLSAILGLGFWYIGGRFSVAFLQAVLLTLSESAAISALALFLSLFFRPGITGMITLTYVFLSHNHDQIRFLQQKGAGGIFSVFMQLTPDAQAWMMDTRIYYLQPVAWQDCLLRMGYGAGWALMFLFLGNAVFYRKNL